MRRNLCCAISQQVWRCVGEQRVTLVVRKSIDCHSRHYFLSQETKANKWGGCDGWHLFSFWISPLGGHWFVSVGAHIRWLIFSFRRIKPYIFNTLSIYQWPLIQVPELLSPYFSVKSKRKKGREQGKSRGEIHSFHLGMTCTLLNWCGEKKGRQNIMGGGGRFRAEGSIYVWWMRGGEGCRLSDVPFSSVTRFWYAEWGKVRQKQGERAKE